MQNSYFRLAFLLILFAYSISHAQDEKRSKYGEAILKESIASLISTRTVETNIRIDIVVDNVEFSARGRYEEQAVRRPFDDAICRSMFRLDLNFLTDMPLMPGAEPNRMTIVCQPTDEREKDRIWQYKSIEGEKTLKFIRIAALENAIRRNNSSATLPNIGEIYNLGGLAGQLRQLERFYEYNAAPIKGKLEGEETLTVWKVNGVLRPIYLRPLISALGGLDKKKQYPTDLPLEIEIYFGAHDYFPYRIQYFNRPTEKSSKRSLLMQFSYFDVRLNGEEISNFLSTFGKGEYPEGVFEVQDETENFIHSLGL